MIAGSYRSFPPRRIRSKLQPLRKWLDRKYGHACSVRHVEVHTRLLTAHRPGSGVANGLFASRFLPTRFLTPFNLPQTVFRMIVGRSIVGIQRAERASPVPPVGPIPGSAHDCEPRWSWPWFLTSAIASSWKISCPEISSVTMLIVGRPLYAPS
jgi:hypothetical protein